MNTILYLLYGIEVLVAILLALVILVQRSKAGGGLGGLATNNAGVEEAFGSGAGNVLVKTTVILSIIFLVNTVSIGIIQKSLKMSASKGVDVTLVDDEKKTGDDAPKTSTDAKKEPATKTEKKAEPAKKGEAKKGE